MGYFGGYYSLECSKNALGQRLETAFSKLMKRTSLWTQEKYKVFF
jgi:hypothetical protein